MCWASAPPYSPVMSATTWRGRSEVSLAQSATPPCERSQPRRPARRTISRASIASGRVRSSSSSDPRRFCSTSSRASAIATSVSDATAARCRNSGAATSAASVEQEHGADDLVARRDRHLGDDAVRHPHGAVAQLVDDVTAQRVDALDRRRRAPPPRPAAGPPRRPARRPPRRRARPRGPGLRRRGRPRPSPGARGAAARPAARRRRAARPHLGVARPWGPSRGRSVGEPRGHSIVRVSKHPRLGFAPLSMVRLRARV